MARKASKMPGATEPKIKKCAVRYFLTIMLFSYTVGQIDSVHAAVSAQARPLELGVEPLEGAVRRIAKEYNVDILYPASLLADRKVRRASNRRDFQSALSDVLEGSDLAVRRSSEGTYYLINHMQKSRPAIPTIISDSSDQTPIVVTARKRSELLEETPLSVAAFGAGQIAENGARGLEDLAAFAPGVYFAQQGSLRPGRIDGSVRFRRMSVNSGNPQDQLGTVFIDGIPISDGLQSIGFEDTERVEVISGPQSAIFGRSTFGGAINIITRQPTDVFGARAEGIVTTNGNTDFTASIEGPLLRGVLNGRLFGRVMRAEGDYSNPVVLGQRLGREATTSLGGSLRLSLGNLKASARVQYSHDDDGPPSGWALGVVEANCGPFGGGTRRTICGNLPPLRDARFGQNTAAPAEVLAILQQNGASLSDLPSAYGMKRTAVSVGFHASLALPSELVFETNAGYNSRTRTVLADSDLSPDPITNAFYAMKSHDTSLEVRLRSHVPARFSWSIGSAYFDQAYRETVAGIYDAYANPANYNPPCTTAPVTCDPAKRLKTGSDGDFYIGILPYFLGHVTTKAVFGSGEIKLLRDLEFNFEARREWDQVDNIALVENSRSQTFSAWLFRSVVSVHPFDRSTIYASASNGNLPGGFNGAVISASAQSRSQLAALGVKDILPQQKLLNLEMGLNFDLDHVSLRMSVYHMRWQNQRIRRTFFDTQIDRTISYLDASGSSNLNGLELQGSWTPVNWLALEATANVAAARYRSLASIVAGRVLGSEDVSGNELPGAPKYSGSLNATVTRVTGPDTSCYFRTDAIYRGRIFVDELNLATLPGVLTLNVRAGIRTGRAGVELFITNLTQSRTPRFAAAQADISAYVPPFDFTYSGFITEAPPSRKIGIKFNSRFVSVS